MGWIPAKEGKKLGQNRKEGSSWDYGMVVEDG
jgi:hypothetical protein